MADSSLNAKNPLDKLDLPKFQWRWEFWLAFIPYIFLFWNPDPILRILLFFIPAIVPTFYWLIRVSVILLKRIKYYPLAYSSMLFTKDRLASLQAEFSEQVLRKKPNGFLEITRASYIDGKLYLTLLKTRGKSLEIGTGIVVIDKQDRKPMGVFEITEIRKMEYYARGVKDIDPLWLGYIIKTGEVNTFPDMIAIDA